MMNDKIVFQLPGLPVSVMAPAECGLSALAVGQKDVPEGVPFWIVGDETIPTDRTFRAAWELDFEAMGEPSGIGGAK